MKNSLQTNLVLASRSTATGVILYTWVVQGPRFLLSEWNTHRMFSRNTSSSRAIPTKKLRRMTMEDPFVPLYLGSNKSGMQAGAELQGWRRASAIAVWKAARYPSVAAHYALEKLGVHKQITNRLIEPHMWVQQIVSATDLSNFFALRAHWMAEPHFQHLARHMQDIVKHVERVLPTAKAGSWVDKRTGARLQRLSPGMWHLPFVDPTEFTVGVENAKKISAARCARVSYLLPENGKRSTLDRDLELFERLAGSSPKHLSPLEHQATPLAVDVYSGNFRGWKQFRKELPDENL